MVILSFDEKRDLNFKDQNTVPAFLMSRTHALYVPVKLFSTPANKKSGV